MMMLLLLLLLLLMLLVVCDALLTRAQTGRRVRDSDSQPVPHAECGCVCGIGFQGERCTDPGAEALVGVWARAAVAKEWGVEGVSWGGVGGGEECVCGECVRLICVLQIHGALCA